MQAAEVVVSFLWVAANRPELLPRKPIPTAPREADGMTGAAASGAR